MIKTIIKICRDVKKAVTFAFVAALVMTAIAVWLAPEAANELAERTSKDYLAKIGRVINPDVVDDIVNPETNYDIPNTEVAEAVTAVAKFQPSIMVDGKQYHVAYYALEDAVGYYDPMETSSPVIWATEDMLR